MRLFLVLMLVSFSACSTSKPCTEAGDFTGIPLVKGDKQCLQKPQKDGSYINDGVFRQWHNNGKLAIEGEFKNGTKNGTWSFYDEKGKKNMERYFYNGVEKLSPPPKEK